MTSQSFYRKWRSQSFADVVGQSHVTRTLRNALNMGRIAHAYLLCGPRGVGKTSVARILAKAINCQRPQDGEPCNSCPMCVAITEGRALDVIEIDAASNRRIEEMRDLRDKVNFAPAEAKRKVYILDEAHMLTNEASNALLKTLEEPPAHTVFVLVTTEAHRLPETIISRCQRFNFRRISAQESVSRLNMVCAQEGLIVSSDTLMLIARSATGSLRDAEGLLDQLVAYCGREITFGHVQDILGLTGEETIRQIVEAVLSCDLAGGLQLVNEAAEAGADLRRLCDDLIAYLRGILLMKGGAGDGVLSDLSSDTIESMRSCAEQIDLSQVVAAIRVFGEVDAGLRGGGTPQLALELAVTQAILQLQRPPDRTDPLETPPSRSRLSIGRIPGEERRPAVHTQPIAPVSNDREVGSAAGAGSIPSKGPPDVSGQGQASPPPSAPAVRPLTLARSIAEKSQTPGDHEGAPADVSSQASGAADTLSQLLDGLRKHWKREIIEGSFGSNKPLQALLRSCDPCQVRGNQIVIGCDSKFHQDKVGDGANRRQLEKAIADLVGVQVPLLFDVVPREMRGQPLLATSDPLVREVLTWGGRIKAVVPTRDPLAGSPQPVDDAGEGNEPEQPGV